MNWLQQLRNMVTTETKGNGNVLVLPTTRQTRRRSVFLLCCSHLALFLLGASNLGFAKKRVSISIFQHFEGKFTRRTSGQSNDDNEDKSHNHEPKGRTTPLSSIYSSCTANPQLVVNMHHNRSRLGTGEKIFLVGLPKAGTTSIGAFFEKVGYRTCDHRCKEVGPPGRRIIGKCMALAKKENKPLVATCGGGGGGGSSRSINTSHTYYNTSSSDETDANATSIEMYAQMDMAGWPNPNICYFPQIQALDDLHREHPDATLILNLRQDAATWADSVLRWYDLSHRLVHSCPTIGPTNVSSIALQEWYCNHVKRIRDFVARHPSHALVELNVQDVKAGEKLAALFYRSTNASHYWGQKNKGRTIKKEDKEKSNHSNKFL